MTPMRSLVLFATLLSALFSGSGCAMTCPTIAWINSVTVALDGDVRKVAWVQLCTPDSCSPATDSPTSKTALSSPTETAGAYGFDHLSAPPSGPAVHRISVERTSPNTWQFGFENVSPGSVTARALDEAGNTITERKLSLDWQRTGRTVGCDGPETASPVTLNLGTS
jgi:hypothetical protein